MITTIPPQYVRRTLVRLQSRGYQAYLVGGCVRDMLMGVQPHDWDICTSALPHEVMEIFPTARPTGLKHGTVTVYINSRSLEVTTFRSESSYADHRHPDSVSFVGDLHTDLSRRDFTMNAIALPVDGLIRDPFGGVQDIKNGIVRCVGEPERRFEEDALRMFRALRFAARLGFEIEEKTMSAIERKAPLAETLAAERVREETEKIILTNSPHMVYELVRLGLLDAYIIKRSPDARIFDALGHTVKKALERWALLSMIMAEQGMIGSVEDFLSSLRLDSRSIRIAANCRRIMRNPLPQTAYQWKKLLNAYDVPTVSCAVRCHDALSGEKRIKELKAVLKSGDCFSVKHLAIGGDELLELGLRGRELGEMLSFLLDYVMEYPENNRREILLNLAAGSEE